MLKISNISVWWVGQLFYIKKVYKIKTQVKNHHNYENTIDAWLNSAK